MNTLVVLRIVAEAEGGGLFSGSRGEAIWTVVAFGLLVFILRKYAWGRILEGLQARQDHVRRQIEAADAAHHEARDALDAARRQVERMMQRAADEARLRQQQLLDQAQREVAALKQRAQDEIDQARAAAHEAVWGQAAEMVGQLAGEVLGRAVSEADDERLIQEALATLKTQWR